ncbi:MAG: lipase/acyltransferase domain-containing protein [Aridibacter sp.]
MLKNKKRISTLATLFLILFVSNISVFAQKDPDLGVIYKDAMMRKGKRPIIIIPGILGSELVNKDTKEKVWFSFSRSGDDDLSLPITTDLKSSRDKLIPGDIIREVDVKLLPNIKVYQGVITSLEKYGGYEEASWDNPPKDINDKFFVFPYDWRRDNVESAQLLIKKIDELRRKTKNPKIKFNVLAHSMGGLITRYALMYGSADLPNGVPKPTWAGENYFGKIYFFGVPNEGSMETIDAVLKGTSSIGAGADLPFLRNLSPLDIATMPAIFQLLPHPKTEHFYDEDLNDLKVNLYDVSTWKKYNWSVYSDDKILKDLSPAELIKFEKYFEKVLNRAQKFHQALDAFTTKRISVGIFIIGGDCIDTLDAVIVYKDEKNEKWKTLTKPNSFKNSSGKKITDEMLKKIMIAPGDGRVTRRSTLAETLSDTRRKSILYDSLLPLTSALFVCESHDDITSNKTIQNNFLTSLISEAEK